ncbi:hypothetical protein [Thiothrix winogradskyi]|uniref:Phenylacetate--CoA ligase family protein n=1 Tax=Thiothrix winogradskyi TaxID=96472 RepID=A0ABY3SZB9_9GAMM|nr:hypothetical protein [Thiothrix winogradskyi]UJS24297.1 hypothetical protein L2Y54_20565 [Thiothrix winogradskyi]
MLNESIYNISPILFQNFIISTYGKKVFKQRYGDVYYHFFEEYIKEEKSNIAKEKENQLIELRSLIEHAKKYSPYYASTLKNIEAIKIKNIDDIKKIPIIEKEELRQNIKSIYTTANRNTIKSFTGGTTGKSLEVYFTQNDFQKRMAYLDSFKYKCGINNIFLSKKATFSGRSFAKGFFQKNSNIYWRFNSAYNQRLYSTFDMQEENLRYYISDLNDYKPEIINGFVSAIYQLAKYVLDNNINLVFTPKAIFTTSETLLSFHRDAIQSAFSCKVFNQYASAEGAPFITECVAGKLHYRMDTGVIETNETGEMLVTSFTTYGTPLIRYNIGDRITFAKNDGYSLCECGSCHPIVESIDGRAVDYLFSPEKGKVSLSHLADVIKGIPNSIKEVQFIQNNIDEIEIHLNVDKKQYTAQDEKKIIESMTYRFGRNMFFTIKLADRIERTRGGKFVLIKNNLIKIIEKS